VDNVRGSEKETVYVLLPVHNRRDTTERFLKCLAKQRYPHIHLILIDDGSTDNTSGMAKEYFPELTLLTGKGNWWWAGSLQQGHKWLQKNACGASDIVLIINDDTTFEADFVENAVQVLRERGRALLLARLYSQHSGEYLEAGVRVDWRTLSFVGTMDLGEINCFSTRGLFFRVRDFQLIGGFHSFLLPHYGTDYEFTMRAFRRGFVALSDSKVKLWFNENTTGIRGMHAVPFVAFLKTSFSKKNTQNPVYLTFFILFSCPMRHIPINLARIWRQFLGGLLSSTKI